jgi:hypothetical protein
MTYVHVYSAPAQPATNYVWDVDGVEHKGGYHQDELLWCSCCNKQHVAADCVVRVYYDGKEAFCAKGKGCKDPEVIAAKKAKEFKNRSEGQKLRWKKQMTRDIVGKWP